MTICHQKFSIIGKFYGNDRRVSVNITLNLILGFNVTKASLEIFVYFQTRLYFLLKMGRVTNFDLVITIAKSKK